MDEGELLMGFFIVAGIFLLIWLIAGSGKKTQKNYRDEQRKPSDPVKRTNATNYYRDPPAVSVVRDAAPRYSTSRYTTQSKWKINPSRVFKDNYLSYSRLSTFDQCPRQFELIYLCENPDVSGEAAEKGSIIHKIAELAAEEYVGSPVNELFTNHTSNSLLDFYDEAVKLVKPKHSFSSKELRPLLENFLDSCDVNDDQIILENEKTIDTYIGDYPVKCIIDRVDEDSKGIKLIDYKTGNKRYVRNLQLEIYGTAYNADSPSGDVQLEYQFLKDGTAKTWSATKSTFSKTTDTITRKAREIETTTTFVRKKTPLCNYCAVSHLCYS